MIKQLQEFFENGELYKKVFQEAYWWALKNCESETPVSAMITYCNDIISYGCLNEDFVCNREKRELFWNAYNKEISYIIADYLINENTTLEEVFKGKWDSYDIFALEDNNRKLLIDATVGYVCSELVEELYGINEDF